MAQEFIGQKLQRLVSVYLSVMLGLAIASPALASRQRVASPRNIPQSTSAPNSTEAGTSLNYPASRTSRDSINQAYPHFSSRTREGGNHQKPQ